MEVVEDQPRLGAPAAAVLLAAALLAAAITYNALWRQTRPGLLLSTSGLEARHPKGSTRLVVDLDGLPLTTVTLRYDSIVESAQRELAAAGLYNGPVDGVAGKRTQLAILAYQRAQGLDLTGTASTALIDHIQLTRQFAAAADTTSSLAADAATGNIRSIQQRLVTLGYDPGAVDGELGAATQIAIRRFQQDHGMVVTGHITEDLIVALAKN